MGSANIEAVQRYRAAFGDSAPTIFPGDTDRFTMEVSGDRVSVIEAQSAAQWSLQLSPGEADTRVRKSAASTSARTFGEH